MNVLIALLVSAVVAYGIIKKYKSQTILLMGGLGLMLLAYWLGYKTEFVPKNQATGFVLFDMFEYIHRLMIKDVAGLGLMIMTCTGFAKYMDYIGASAKMVELAMKPLQMLNAPYLVLAGGFVVCNVMSLVIPSASGLAMLMMVTVYPILVRLGVSRVGAASVVATGHILDIGPASATTLLVTKTAGVDINQFFVERQLPVYLMVCIAGALTHYFWQKYLDGKISPEVNNKKEDTGESKVKSEEDLNPAGPAIYVILPLLPLFFLLGFSQYGIKGIKMNVNLAMLLSFAIAMLFEFVRLRDFKKGAAGIQKFFKGMGDQYANTITLVTAGQVFAYGLTSIGFISSVIDGSKNLGLGATEITVAMCGFIILSSMLMGSGVASMFSFSPLVPAFAKGLGGDAMTMLQAMQNSASLGRLLSPITAVIVAVAAIADVSGMDLVKRNTVPVIVCMVVSILGVLIMF